MALQIQIDEEYFFSISWINRQLTIAKQITPMEMRKYTLYYLCNLLNLFLVD